MNNSGCEQYSGMTPLHLAARGGSRKIVEMLLSLHADVGIGDAVSGAMCIDCAMPYRRNKSVIGWCYCTRFRKKFRAPECWAC